MPLTNVLDAGFCRLRFSLSGAQSSHAEQLISERMAAFLTPSPAANLPELEVRVALEPGTTVSTLASDAAINPRVIATGADSWYAEWQFFRGNFSRRRVDAVATARHPGLEHVLRMATLLPFMPERGLAFHAATLRWGEGAYLLCGHPNAGKSTISREGGADEVICNELSFIEERAGQWWALPSPFWGTGDNAQRATPAPLKGIAILGQAKARNEWQQIPGIKALEALFPHVGCQSEFQYEDPRLLASLTRLVQALPTYAFHWYRPADPLEGSPWKL